MVAGTQRREKALRRFIAWPILALLVTVVPTALITPARADEPPFYNVELIVFKNLDPGVMDAERWPTQPTLTAPSRFLSLGSLLSGAAATMGLPYQNYSALAPADLQLDEAVKRLKASRHYRILLHTGWRQPPADQKDGLPLWIDMTIPPGDAHSPAPPVTASGDPSASAADGPLASNPPATAPNQSAGPVIAPGPATPNATVDQPRLEGTVQFYVSRYMHFEVHLAYLTSRPAQPDSPNGAPGDTAAADGQAMGLPANISATGMTAPNVSAQPARTPVVFQIDEERRVRSGELHYFDHPGFGVLVQVTPYTPPKGPAAGGATQR